MGANVAHLPPARRVPLQPFRFAGKFHELRAALVVAGMSPGADIIPFPSRR